MDRLIAHLDMDCFYAAVEELDDPSLQGKPVAVGGAGRRGVVSAANYPARSFGVRSALPMFQAQRLCPDLIIRPVRMKRYVEISRRVMGLLEATAPVVEQISVDEAFLDMTGTTGLYGPAEQIGAMLKAAVREEVGLACSVGLAPNKLIAKIASDLRKPDGLVIVPADAAEDFLAALPVVKLPGIGPKMAAKLKMFGVDRIDQLRRFGQERLEEQFGVWGAAVHSAAWGRDDSPVQPGGRRKSISTERTLGRDEASAQALLPLLADQALETARAARRKGFVARTVVLKIKHADFRQITRSHTLDRPTANSRIIFHIAADLLAEYSSLDSWRPIRLIGVGLANLEDAASDNPKGQLNLFDEKEHDVKEDGIDQAIDKISSLFGSQALRLGVSLKKD